LLRCGSVCVVSKEYEGGLVKCVNRCDSEWHFVCGVFACYGGWEGCTGNQWVLSKGCVCVCGWLRWLGVDVLNGSSRVAF